MLELFPSCGIRTIPSRLYTSDRVSVLALDSRDRLFIRHAPLPNGGAYGFQIPGHDHLEDQSANSERLNSPGGYSCDVLYDSSNGKHHIADQIACLDVFRILELVVPIENTIQKGRNGAI